MRRPRAEHCERLAAGELRALVEPGSGQHRLADGTLLELRWSRCRGCFGGVDAWALALGCPLCSATCRVLWRPPAAGWGCWRCHPLSYRSHRRPGARAGRGKPPRWHLAQLSAEQLRIADLVGLVHWPPEKLLWGRRDLAAAPRWPDAPQLSPERERALLLRLEALALLRVAVLVPTLQTDLAELGADLQAELKPQKAAANRVLAATRWALRRPAGDPRSRRQQLSQAQAESNESEFVAVTGANQRRC